MALTEVGTLQHPSALVERSLSLDVLLAREAVISHGEVDAVPDAVLQTYLESFYFALTEDYDRQDESTTYYSCLAKKLQDHVNVFLAEEHQPNLITDAQTCAKAIEFQMIEDSSSDAPLAATKLMHGFLGQLYALELYYLDTHAPERTVPLTELV